MISKEFLLNEIGIRLLELRQSKNFSLDEVANAVDVSKSTLSNIERGKHMFNIYLLYRLALFFEVEVSYFMPLVSDSKELADWLSL